ncbi:HAD family hydrolase [Natronosalvus halobius]|uniref:HAD family hydrolase n=1 Tax=Natronosalvus halobius TaxID=2953746 RepID=UPI00209D2526|nr:HAD-IA family hydrolase [Natronosalvus halobius]USZ72060.1 HAD-IA family hydrolase [Natronosalvus halobius]
MAYDAVVFDNDGVLTTPTSYEALTRAMTLAFERHGIDDPVQDDLETLISPTIDELEAVTDRYGLETESLWAARERAAIEVQREELLDGNKTLYDDVTTLETVDVPMAIVSNNQHETIENIVAHFELEAFDPYYGREPTVDGIRRKKPTPYYLERAIDDLACSNPLYVGDSWVDVAVAEALEIDSAFIRRSHRENYAFTDFGYDGEPTHEITSLEALTELEPPS